MNSLSQSIWSFVVLITVGMTTVHSQTTDPVEALIHQLSVEQITSESNLANTAIQHNTPQRSTSIASPSAYSQQNWIQAFPIPKSAMRISSDFGSREMAGRFENHQGIDFAAPTGTPIYASGAGIVTKAGWGNGYGQYVEINHGNGYLTRYGHASQLHVQVGDRVNSGELIANVGCTGRCTGPHLHYEVVKDGQRRNPASYLALLP